MCGAFKSTLAALIVLGATTTPVLACINDREVDKSEREFKSYYLDQQLTGPQSDPTDRSDLMIYGGMGTGVLFLVGATVVGFRKSSHAS